MKKGTFALLLLTSTLCCVIQVLAQVSERSNPQIDYPGFVRVAAEIQSFRAERRVSEDQFLTMARDAKTIILDTRSKEKFKQMHVKGAVHLNFSDITTTTLAKVVPSKATRILIYCNNNFMNAPDPFPTKMGRAALNIPTFITLYEYGYRNIYELAPVLDPSNSKLSYEVGK